MQAQIQRLAILTVLSLTTWQVHASGCEDELSFSLARQINVEKPDESEEDKDRVRIMPAGSVNNDYEIKRENDAFEVYKKPFEGEDDALPALVARWTALPGHAVLQFDALGHSYVVWARSFNGLPEIVIAKIEDPREPVFHFSLTSADEFLLSGSLKLGTGKNDFLSLQTGKRVYVVEINQLRGRVQQSGEEQSQNSDEK